MTTKTEISIFIHVMSVILIAFLILIIMSRTSRDTEERSRLKSTCFPYQVVSYFNQSEESYAVCAAENQEFKIIKVSKK